MPSYVIFEERARFNPDILIFGVFNYETIPSIYVEGINNGIITIDPPINARLEEFCEFVAGIFDSKSNCVKAICDQLNVSTIAFKGVSFCFNKFHYIATKENSDAKIILKEWKIWWKKHKKESC